MINLFIDSNIWLSLYHFTNDDLDQFGKLKKLMDEGAVKLYLPIQVKDEVRRNRENKIKDALKGFKLEKLSFPAFVKYYPEYKEFNAVYSEVRKKYSRWMERINDDISNENCPADRTINELFQSAEVLACPTEIVAKAVLRYNCGNPPGKDNKYGDAINWECLLQHVPEGEDIYFVSADGDYKSAIDKFKINPFLKSEWEEKKKSRICFYSSLVEFLQNNLSDIKLGEEQKKEELIDWIADSRSFAETHSLIGKLSTYSDWTDKQVEDLCTAAENNTQVRWLLGDEDVFSFYNVVLGANLEYGDSRPLREAIADRLAAFEQKELAADSWKERMAEQYEPKDGTE